MVGTTVLPCVKAVSPLVPPVTIVILLPHFFISHIIIIFVCNVFKNSLVDCYRCAKINYGAGF